MARLSEEEISTYREEGLVIPEYRLPGNLFAELCVTAIA